MWPRVVELMLGLWLIISPFVFREPPWGMDLIAGFAVIALSLASYSSRLAYAHFLTLALGIVLIVYGYIDPHPRPPAAQNEIVTGLLLAMLAIIPNSADLPPSDYREDLR